MIKFVILAFPRSGSTYLCSRLNAHPKVLCHYEVFHPDAIATEMGFEDKVPQILQYTPQTRDEYPAAFLATLFSHDMGREAVGFKIFVGQSEEAHRLVLSDTSIAKIMLHRSTVDAYVSMLIAQRTGEYTSTSESQKPTRIAIDAGGLVAFDTRIESYFADIESTLRRTDQRYLKLQYEELVTDDTALDPLFAFLGIPRGDLPLVPFTKRQNSDDLGDKVSNLKEVLEDLLRFYRQKAGAGAEQN